MPSKLKHKRHGEGFHGYALLAPKPRRKFNQAPGGRVRSLIIIIIKPVIIQGPRPLGQLGNPTTPMCPPIVWSIGPRRSRGGGGGRWKAFRLVVYTRMARELVL